jgi:phenylalanyl-tRNA synthetase beta subunit
MTAFNMEKEMEKIKFKQEAELIDVYHLPEDEKVMTIRMVLTPWNRTFTNEEIKEITDKTARYVCERTGARLRA